MITTRTSTVPALVLIVEDDPPIADLIAALHADADAAGRSPAPVIVLTAASARMARESGADALLTKPFDLAELEGLLHRFLA